MPTYSYLCGACNHKFEKFQSMSSNPSMKCPKCGKYKLKRLIGAGSGIIFKKGCGGFYSKDYSTSKSPEKKKEKKDMTWKKGPAKLKE